MEKFGIKGLRSLVDTGSVAIKPINILVGTNSSGKSTFLRCFPLIRQSIERRTRGPILWNGVYTDFESFLTSLHNGGTSNTPSESIEFTFTFPFETYAPRFGRSSVDLNATIRLKAGSNKHSCYTYNYSLLIGDHQVNFDFEEDGTIKKIYSSQFKWELEERGFKLQPSDIDSMLPVIMHPGFRHGFFFDKKESILTSLHENIKELIRKHSGSQSEDKIKSITRYLVGAIRLNTEKLEVMRGIKSTKKWNCKVNSWTVKNREFKFLSGLIDLFTLIENSYSINEQLGRCFKNVRYIAPLRASTERYYRYQDLSVDELDHRGENIGMFLSNIPKKWRLNLDNWTKKYFGFEIKETTSSSHIAIKLKYGQDGVSDNVADMGFGFSQILPIVVQLWSVASGYEKSMKGNSGLPFIFAIEQPELHLHPKMQATLASVFSSSIALANDNKIDLRLIIETHSSAMISKLGDLVALDEVDKDYINVLLFEQDRRERITNLSYSKFNGDGELEQWPSGFFTY